MNMGSPGFFDSGLVLISGYIAGGLIGLGVAILVGAIMLRIAGKVLGYPSIRFENALYATAIAAVTMFSIQFTIVSNYIGMAISTSARNGGFAPNPFDNIMFMFGPTFMTFTTVMGILLTGLLYQRLIQFSDEEQYDDDDNEVTPSPFKLNYGDSICLAAVQIGVSMLCCLIFAFAMVMAFSVLTNL